MLKEKVLTFSEVLQQQYNKNGKMITNVQVNFSNESSVFNRIYTPITNQVKNHNYRVSLMNN